MNLRAATFICHELTVMFKIMSLPAATFICHKLAVIFKMSLPAVTFVCHELTVIGIGHGLKMRLWPEILSLGLTN